jgi:homogentisate 1,2-dioxygenase
MGDCALYSADGDLMLIPDTGALEVRTELGLMRVAPGQLAVVPRGLLMSVGVPDGVARGLVLEVYARHFQLPERGVIGANGLADERHFESPVAAYEDREVEGGYRIVAKMGGRLWQGRKSHSPFDVVGWHGDYLPYRYDLSKFNAMGTVTWDHPDPSIFTVLSAPLDHPGENLADFVVFPNPRWDVAWDTFRPPYYHRNAATEFNALVAGPTSPERVFTRGGYFYTPPFTAHGVKPEIVEKWYRMSDDEANAPKLLRGDHLWIQFESTLPLSFSSHALESETRDRSFREFASGVRSYFDPNQR